LDLILRHPEAKMTIAIKNTLKHPVFLLLLALFFIACAQIPRVNRHGLPQREYVYQEPEVAEFNQII